MIFLIRNSHFDLYYLYSSTNPRGAVMEELAAFFIQIFRQGFPCLFKLLTGLYYSGCGGDESGAGFASGRHFPEHPVPFPGFLRCCGNRGGACEPGHFQGSKNPRLYLGHEAFFIYTATGLVLANWLFKNYMLAVRGIDLLPAFG